MIETDRLHLIPLTANQLNMWIEDIPAIERELNCTYRAEKCNIAFHSWVGKSYAK